MIALFLEDKTNKFIHHFYNSDDFEEFLKENNTEKYMYVNILFMLDDEMNWEITKIYKKRYSVALNALRLLSNP